MQQTIPLKFQFQNGTIKRLKMANGKYLFACFNSKMVRLKGFGRFTEFDDRLRFNSKMVRLKDMPGMVMYMATYVSIPKWYD